MKTKVWVILSTALVCSTGFAESVIQRNLPPACDPQTKTCSICPTGEVTAGCIKINLDMGVSTPWTGSIGASLRVFADDASPLVFTAESIHPVFGYTFKRLGNRVLSDGVTAKDVVFSHPAGEPVTFTFEEGESLGRPDPGVHVPMNERLMMVDAQGWACTHDPVYYDLYLDDGRVRRFRAALGYAGFGAFVSEKDSRGVTVTAADMGFDIVYGPDGVRQFLTPSRLADVRVCAGGYDIAVYPVQTAPAKDPATGLYALPAVGTVKFLSLRSAKGGKEAVVTLRSGDAEAKVYRFEYLREDWSLTRPDGIREDNSRAIEDSVRARISKEVRSPSGVVLSREDMNYVYRPWGYAMTNRVEGFGTATRTTAWDYVANGYGRGLIRMRLDPTGLKTEYNYDPVGRKLAETRSGPGMMTEVTTFSYESVDPLDAVPPVDARPRTVVRTFNGIECERTYYVYSPLTNIVERVGVQGAPFGGTNALRTVTAFYPVVAGDLRSGMVGSVRHEDGALDRYDYSLTTNIWTKTVTHLHEQSPAPVSGKTTRDVTLTNARGETLERRTEAFIDGTWHIVSRDRMAYDNQGRRIRTEDLAGQVTVTEWDCCRRVAETRPDGSAVTWDYDDEGNMTATSRLIPLDRTNVTWLTTAYAYNSLGRQTATWTTNLAERIGLPATRTSYDALGRAVARTDVLGNETTTSYSPDGRTMSVRSPNGATMVYTRNAAGDALSVTGTAVTPEFTTRGMLADGTRWTKTVQGETADSPRFTTRYENMLGQTVREERSGFRSAVLTTISAYDAYGRLISSASEGEPTVVYTYGIFGNRIATKHAVRDGGEWRRSETSSNYTLIGSDVWQIQTNTVSCSDAAIAPLVTSGSVQLTGLAPQNPARARSTDVRGNVTEEWVEFTDGLAIAKRRVPEATNIISSTSRYGIDLETVSLSTVTNSVRYDALGRQVAAIDGRGNVTKTEYDAYGRPSAILDPTGARTAYGYNAFGELIAITNALGHATVYEYDLRGRKVYEGGATYPVRYTYDIFGNKVSMTTYRNESKGTADTTRWLYDEASNCVTNKVYADGKGPSYDYDARGRLIKRTWARGVITDYSYDGLGNLTNITYSDDTPRVSLAYDAMGRQVCAVDAAGVTTFAYDSFGSLPNETVVGVAGTNTIERFYDTFGRSLGYALNGVRQSTLGYDPATGRLATMLANGSDVPFTWNYLPGSDLKSSLAYPNGLSASWTYDANAQLLQVCNAFPTNVISQYDYTYDAAGRRVSCAKSGSAFVQNDTLSYGYSDKSELTNAVAAVDADYRYSYDFDDIGNRESSFERGTNSVYAANQLNQYTAVDDFTPEFDDDGNQTLVKTATGVWQVCYNAEDRPVLWTSGITNIVMSFDHMGRRTEYLETTAAGTGVLHLVATNIHHRFVYDGYICVRRLVVAGEESSDVDFVWDPTEPAATRTLVIQQNGGDRLVAAHDGGKNVTELLFLHGSTAAHYECSPFGELVGAAHVPFPVGVDFYAINPFRFSSEYYDRTLGLVYYNYRHYSPSTGRWLSREKAPLFVNNSYAFLDNVANSTDMLGLYDVLVHYYLMYALMRELGYTDAQAQEIAAGSQYPDTREWDAVGSEWDAVYERFRPNTQRLEYRELFHNLNSLDYCGILAFRRCLAEKIDKEETLFLKGVYLHTLADTYAHLDPSTMCSYGREDGHMDDGFAPDDVQWVRNGEEIGRERLYGLLATIKEALGKENVDTPEMDSFLKKLYEHNYLFFKSIWWYFYTPSLQIPKYAHNKGLRDNIDPNNSYGNPLKNDEQIREKVLPNLKECLDRVRKP